MWVADRTPAGKPAAPRDPKWFETNLDDLTHFLADRLRDDEGEPIKYSVLRKLYGVVFDLITDVLVETGEVTIPHLGQFRVWRNYRGTHSCRTWFIPEEKLIERMNETETHLTLKTESVLEAINAERAVRLAKNDKQIEVQRRYVERKKAAQEKENENPEEGEE